MATPRKKIAAPIVMMMVVTTDAPKAGSMANRSSNRPTKIVIKVAAMAASGNGKPAMAASGNGKPTANKAIAVMAPSITNSP